MKPRVAEFDMEFLRDLREILLSASVSESYDSAGRALPRKNKPFLDPWQLRSFDFDPELGRKRVIAKFSSGGYEVEASIDASDFSGLVGRKSRNRAWNGTRYQDAAVLVSVLIEEQIVTWEPAELTASRIRICRPADR